MSDERRYDDTEIRAIFALAAESGDRELPANVPGAGLTLAELQRIGETVGLDRGRVATAATRLDLRRDAVRARTYFGLPLSVGMSAELPRALGDAEWEILVGEIREVFDARGRLTGTGGLREWTNGNLHVFLEATERGHRIRIGTTKGTAVRATRIGLAMVGLAVILLGVLLVTGQLAEDLFMPIFLGALGVAALGSNVLILPYWARERERQMEHVVARALELTESERGD